MTEKQRSFFLSFMLPCLSPPGVGNGEAGVGQEARIGTSRVQEGSAFVPTSLRKGWGGRGGGGGHLEQMTGTWLRVVV